MRPGLPARRRCDPRRRPRRHCASGRASPEPRRARPSCSRRGRRRAAASSARTPTAAARRARTTAKLTKAVICSSTFHTGTIRNVPDSEKYQVEIEYGLAPRSYGARSRSTTSSRSSSAAQTTSPTSTPRRRTRIRGYHVKDKLENKLHDLVCDGTMTLRRAQRQIAANWQALYRGEFLGPPRWADASPVPAREDASSARQHLLQSAAMPRAPRPLSVSCWMKREAMVAVSTERKPIPTSMSRMPTILPATVFG